MVKKRKYIIKRSGSKKICVSKISRQKVKMINCRKQLADDLMRGCPEELREDHQAIAVAIRRGDSPSKILDMKESNEWPDTYIWLKSRL